MKTRILTLLSAFALTASAQINVQKNASGVVSNGNIVIGNNTTLTATGNGSIIATGGTATSIAWANVTGTPTTLSGYGVTNTLSTTAPITGGGALSGNLTIAMPAATSGANGYLTSSDWTTFNSKQAALGPTVSFSANVITSNSVRAAGSAGLTLDNNSGTPVLTVGQGGGTGATFSGNIVVPGIIGSGNLTAQAASSGSSITLGQGASSNILLTPAGYPTYASGNQIQFNSAPNLTNNGIRSLRMFFPSAHRSGAPWVITSDTTTFGGPAEENDTIFLWGFNTVAGGNPVVPTGGSTGARKFYFQMEHDYYQVPGGVASRMDEWHLNVERDNGVNDRLFQVSYFPATGATSTGWSGSFEVFNTNSLNAGNRTAITASGVTLASAGALNIKNTADSAPVTVLRLDSSDRTEIAPNGLGLVLNTSPIRLDGNLDNSSSRPATSAAPIPGEIWGYSRQTPTNVDGFLRLSAGGGSGGGATKTYIDLSGFSSVPTMDRTITLFPGATQAAQFTATATELSGNLTVATGNITGGAANMTITAGTGNSRTLALRTTTSGGTATDALTIGATQVVTLPANVASTNSTTGTLVVTGGAGVGGALNVGGNITATGGTITSTITGSSAVGVQLSPTFTPPAANQYGLRSDLTINNGSAAGGTVSGINVSATTAATSNVADVEGITVQLNRTGGSAAQQSATAFKSSPANLAGGSMTNLYHFKANDVFVSSGSVTTQYGLHVAALATAGTNYAIYTAGAGLVRFGDTTEATTGGAGSVTTLGGIYAAKKVVTSGDVEVADIGEGIIIKSPNGTRWRITVSDAGAFVATSL